MSIGVIVDGMAEYRSLGSIIEKISASSRIIQQPIYCDIQPYSTTGIIVRTVLKRLPILLNKGANRVVVLVDLENRRECPGDFALEIKRNILEELEVQGKSIQIDVVIKNRKYENWLIADLRTLRSFRRRFRIGIGIQRAISPNKADNVDAEKLLKQSVIPSQTFHKVRDAKTIMGRANPHRIAANSRSFRRFLRVVGDNKYQNQSIRPL